MSPALELMESFPSERCLPKGTITTYCVLARKHLLRCNFLPLIAAIRLGHDSYYFICARYTSMHLDYPEVSGGKLGSLDVFDVLSAPLLAVPSPEI